jgi:hypothetical protein
MKLKKEYIILPVIIIALVLYLVLHKSNRTNYTLPQIDKVTVKQIDKIEIKKGADTIVLNKKDGTWLIGEQSFPADSTKIDKMPDMIANLTLSALVSESKNYTRYELDNPQKITVQAWEGSTPLRSFDLGKAAATFQHTFVKLEENPNVYHARGNFRSTFDKTVSDLRDKIVMSFKQDEITEISVTRDKAAIVLKLKEIDNSPAPSDKDSDKNKDAQPVEDEKAAPPVPPTKIWESADGQKVNENEIKSLLTMLTDYKCKFYIKDKTKDDLSNPLTLITLKGSEEHTIALYAKTDKDVKTTPAVSSSNAYPFFMDDTQVENLNKKIDALIKKETPSEDQKSAETEKSATETKVPEDTKKSDEN